MNMPMHIMAKPIQTVAVTASAGLFSVAEIIAGPVEDSCGRPLDTSPSFGHKPTAEDMQIRMGVLRCPILGQSDSGQGDILENLADLTAMSAVAGDGKTPCASYLSR